MKLLNSSTDGQWLTQRPPVPPPPPGHAPAAPPSPDPFWAEARRVVSDVFRCNNLIVLSGLGTSLCIINSAGSRLAPTMWDLWEAVRQATDARPTVAAGTDPNFAQLLSLVGFTQSHDIEALLSHCRVAEVFHDGDNKAAITRFISLAESSIAHATSFVAASQHLPVHAEFLRRAARRSERKARAKIFTTNYDRAFEEAARQQRFVVVDGFSTTEPPTFDPIHFSYDTVRRHAGSETLELIPNVVHLYKLHGSVDWWRNQASGEIHRGGQGNGPLLIYPRNTKYEMAFQQPYLDLIGAFQTALREPNTGVVVAGFGFNDKHLAEPIMAAVRSNLSLKMVVVSPRLAPLVENGQPDPGECGSNDYLRTLGRLATAGDARVSLLNASFEQFIHLVPDIAAETDLEQHAARLRSMAVPP